MRRSRRRRCTGSASSSFSTSITPSPACCDPAPSFLDGDRLDFDHDQRTIAVGARQVRPEWPDAPEGPRTTTPGGALRSRSRRLTREVVEREQRWQKHPHEDESHSYEFHRSALFSAGFVEVGTLWQHLANRVAGGDPLTEALAASRSAWHQLRQGGGSRLKD